MGSDEARERSDLTGDAALGEAERTAVPAASVAGPWRRLLLPAALGVAAWLAFWTVDNVCLQMLARRVGQSPSADLIWPRIPALVLLPRFGWLLFPVLLLCIHLCARTGGGASDRTVVALAPAVIAPLVYWRSLDALLAVMTTSRHGMESLLLYRGRWNAIFFAPEYLALVLTCALAVVIYALAPRAIRNATSPPEE